MNMERIINVPIAQFHYIMLGITILLVANDCKLIRFLPNIVTV